MADFKFPSNKEELKSKYWTYLNYLTKRCSGLPSQIEKKYNGKLSASHTESTCYGMSNYIDIEKLDENGDTVDWLTIRISDHEPTGSGNPCDAYLYICGNTWKEIKKEIFQIVENFLK